MNKEKLILGLKIIEAFQDGRGEIKIDDNISVVHGGYTFLYYNDRKILKWREGAIGVWPVSCPKARALQNVVLYYFGVRLRKVRMADKISARKIDTNGLIRHFYMDDDHISDLVVVKRARLFVDREERNALYNIYTRENNSIASYLYDYIPYRLDEMRGIKLSEGYDKLSFIPPNKPYLEKYRQEVRVGKFVRKFCPKGKYSDSTIENFVNSLKASSPHDFDFEVVKGEDIKKYYHYKRYVNDNNSLGGSCMKGDGQQRFFSIYMENPDVCSMLIFKNSDDNIMGRALLWHFTDEYTGKEMKLMDRIYGSDVMFKKFKAWAVENGYWFKAHQSYEDKYMWRKKIGGDEFSKKFKFKLKTDWKYYPYLDTFSYMGNGWLSNDVTTRYSHALTTTEGILDGDYVTCYETGDEIHETEAVYCNDIDEYVYEDYAIYCSEDERMIYRDNAIRLHNGDYVHTHYAEYCNYNEYYVLNSEVGVCEHTGNTFDMDETDYTIVEDGHYVITEFVEQYYEENGYTQNSEGDWEKAA